MKTAVKDYFDDLAQHLSDRDYAGIGMKVSFPLGIYEGDEIHRFNSMDEFEAALDSIGDAQRAAGIVRQTATVKAESIRLGCLRSYWVEWRHFDAGGAEVGKAFARYYCDAGPAGEPDVKLIELLDSEGDPGTDVLSMLKSFALTGKAIAWANDAEPIPNRYPTQ